jgi:hypothetical protein
MVQTMQWIVMVFGAIALATAAATAAAPTTGTGAAQEPDVKRASEWWTDLTNVVTPVAWRDHPHRFCIVYNGTLIALPQPEKLLRFEWDKGRALDGVQLDFTASSDGAIPAQPNEPYWLSLPGGKRIGDQGWEDRAAPVLWTRWRASQGAAAGITLRQRVFAHMAGGGEAVSGTEPMFAWIRLEVEDRAAGAQAGACGFLVKISAPHMRFDMSESDNCRVMPKASAYPKPLTFQALDDARGAGGLVIEASQNVRLAVLPGGAASIKHLPPGAQQRDDFLYITLPDTAGAHVDLLLPMIPAPRAALNDELALGYEGALAQAERFWSGRPSTAATIHTPEPLINAAIADGVRLARMLSVTVPSTRQRSLLSGAMYYSYLWTTPTSMTEHMLLDPMGWHGDVAKYLEIYREDQGRTTAPGPDFKPHPGYFGPPKVLDSGNQWLTDHGAVLYTAARHALLTDDPQFIQRWLEPILKACDFIKQARRLPRKAPAAEGVMPPANASDISRPIQAFWSDGWNYKALAESARLLRVLNHPRAAEFEAEAADYREAIARAIREKAARQPKWTDPSGRQHSIVPMTLTRDDTDGLSFEHPFYLDTGPIFGVYAGVLHADDPLMRDAVDFLREGPQTRDGSDARFSWRNTPRLIHEISSAEPCYSWNVFHSHQLGDRERYLEGMYSLFTGALSRQTHVSCETRGGITENVFATTLAVDLARLAVVDDEIEPGTLHLMRLTPLAWISAAEQTRFENMPTEFGPVTLKWKLSADGRSLAVDYAPKFRRPPRAVLLHVPPAEGLEKVLVNGVKHPAKGGDVISL